MSTGRCASTSSDCVSTGSPVCVVHSRRRSWGPSCSSKRATSATRRAHRSATGRSTRASDTRSSPVPAGRGSGTSASAAKAHRLQLPHLYDDVNSVGGNIGLQGASRPSVGLPRRAARSCARHWPRTESATCRSVWTSPRRRCSLRWPKPASRSATAQQVMMDAREIKSQDEITLLTQACAMVDGLYHESSSSSSPACARATW